MICPRCSVAQISPLTDACELCGFAPGAAVAVEAPPADALGELTRRELAHQFQIDFPIGQGPASALYLAREKGSDRLVILKVLPRLPSHPSDADARFRNAVSAVQALDHAHLVPILRCATTDSVFWYSMEAVGGRPLREVLRALGPMELKTCLRICTQVASALDYVHRRALVHGDLKPENVLIDQAGWARVCDALIPRELQRQPRPVRPSTPAQPAAGGNVPGRTSKPAARVTPAEQRPSSPGAASLPPRPPYVAPEDHAEGFCTASSDQYALAVLVYECLTGYPPGAGLPTGAAPASLESLRPDLPRSVSYAVQRAMSDRPADRFASVLDFVTMLESSAAPTTLSRPSGRPSQVLLMDDEWEPLPDSAVRRIVRAVAKVAAVLVVAGAALFIVTRIRDNSAPPLVLPIPAPSSAPASDSAAVASVAPPAATDAGAAPSRSGATSSRSRRPSASARSTGTSRNSRRPPPRESAPAPAVSAAPGGGAPGRLFVNATPWGLVLVDGQAVGNTPRANIQLPPGSHRLQIVREGYDPFNRTITIGAGETVRLTDIVLAEHRP